jgi:hypothetical protein
MTVNPYAEIMDEACVFFEEFNPEPELTEHQQMVLNYWIAEGHSKVLLLEDFSRKAAEHNARLHRYDVASKWGYLACRLRKALTSIDRDNDGTEQK